MIILIRLYTYPRVNLMVEKTNERSFCKVMTYSFHTFLTFFRASDYITLRFISI